MKDTGESPIQPVPVPVVLPDARGNAPVDKPLEPKFLEVVEQILEEDAELLKRLAS